MKAKVMFLLMISLMSLGASAQRIDRSAQLEKCNKLTDLLAEKGYLCNLESKATAEAVKEFKKSPTEANRSKVYQAQQVEAICVTEASNLCVLNP